MGKSCFLAFRIDLSLLSESFVRNLSIAVLQNLTLKVQVDCQCSGIFVNFEHWYLASVKRRKKLIPVSLLELFSEVTANFTELVLFFFKQASSLSFESFMPFFEWSSDHVVNLPECTVHRFTYFTQYLDL